MPTGAIAWECAKCGRKPLFAHAQDAKAAIGCCWCEQVYCVECIHFPACAECRTREGGRQATR